SGAPRRRGPASSCARRRGAALHAFLQGFPDPLEERVDGDAGASHPAGDGGRIQALVIAEREETARAARELFETAPQGFLSGVQIDPRAGLLEGALQAVQEAVIELDAASLAVVFADLMPGDHARPGGEVAAVLELVGLADGDQADLLEDVLD